MKIAHFIGGLYKGGKERRLFELINNIENDKRYDFIIIVRKRIIEYKEFYNLKSKIYILDETPFNKLKVLFNIYNICKNEKVNIIQTWDYTTSLITLILKLSQLNFFWLNSQITTAPSSRFTYGLRFYLLSKICFHFSDKILSNSKAGLKSFRISNKKGNFIYNGFNFNRIMKLDSIKSLKMKFSINEKYIVTMIASFNKRKDYNTFLKVAHFINKFRNDIAFLCVGDGKSKKYFEKKYSFRNNNNIYFLGSQNNVESIINASDIGILLTNRKYHGEGISNALMEFMSLKKPVIASDNGGNKELINNKLCGIILKQNDLHIISNEIIKLLDSKILLKNYGNEGQKRIKDYFSIDLMTDRYKKTYNKCLHL